MIPENYEESKAKTASDTSLSLGGHICRIIDIELYSTNNGNQSLKVMFDIDEDSEYKNYFINQVDNSILEDEISWPNSGTKYISLNPKNVGYLKRFIECVEQSNNIMLNVVGGQPLDLHQFLNKKVVCQFGITEYLKEEEVTTALKIVDFYPTDELENVKIPKVRLLNGNYMEYEKYLESKNR